MGIAKNGYYTTKDILQHKAQYNIVYSARSDGKSFDVKRLALSESWQTKKALFGLIRRWKDDIETSLVNAYFVERNVNLIKEVTNGECDCIDYYRKFLWFSRTNAEGKIEHVQKCGEVFALNIANKRYKSTGHPEIKYLVYEEFLTDEGYLPNEPDKLQNLISSIGRKDDLIIFLLGNKVSRVCPYFTEWSLKNIKKQKEGTIDDYYHETEEVDEEGKPVIIHIAVEHSAPSPKKSKMFFGRAEKSIQGGSWQTGNYPKLPEPFESYEKIYELTYISISQFAFKVVLLCHKINSDLIVFVYPSKAPKSFYEKPNEETEERYITGSFSTNIFVTPTLNKESPVECLIHNLFIDNKVCYSDNLCGEDFTQSCKAELKYPF